MNTTKKEQKKLLKAERLERDRLAEKYFPKHMGYGTLKGLTRFFTLLLSIGGALMIIPIIVITDSDALALATMLVGVISINMGFLLMMSHKINTLQYWLIWKPLEEQEKNTKK